MRLRYFFMFALIFATVSAAHAAAVRSTSRNQRNAVMEYSGFFLNPIGTEPQGPGDLAPPQLFEIVRPNDQAITIGRLYTSCVCVALEAEKTSFAAGEQAVLRLRNIRLSPPEGMLYAIYVQMRSPIRTILRADTFLQSTEFLPSQPGEAPTRGDIVADGVLTEEETTEVELIVPTADAEVPDDNGPIVSEVAEVEEAGETEETVKEGE
jgi:hypothetical protein